MSADGFTEKKVMEPLYSYKFLFCPDFLIGSMFIRISQPESTPLPYSSKTAFTIYLFQLKSISLPITGPSLAR